MSESGLTTKRSGSSPTGFADHFGSVAHFCLVRAVLSPLLLFLLIYEIVGALAVVAGAGLITGGIYGISVTSGRSVLMWALLALGIVLPLIYYSYNSMTS